MINYVWSGRQKELSALEPDGWTLEKPEEAEDEEANVGSKPGDWERREKRPVILYAPLISGLAMILCFVFIGSGMRNLIKETLLDGTPARFALMATCPFGYCLAIVSGQLVRSC